MADGADRPPSSASGARIEGWAATCQLPRPGRERLQAYVARRYVRGERWHAALRWPCRHPMRAARSAAPWQPRLRDCRPRRDRRMRQPEPRTVARRPRRRCRGALPGVGRRLPRRCSRQRCGDRIHHHTHPPRSRHTERHRSYYRHRSCYRRRRRTDRRTDRRARRPVRALNKRPLREFGGFIGRLGPRAAKAALSATTARASLHMTSVPSAMLCREAHPNTIETFCNQRLHEGRAAAR